MSQKTKPIPNAELYNKLGLYKQAFTHDIYAPYDWEYYRMRIRSFRKLVERLLKASPHLYQAADVFMMYRKEYPQVVGSLKKNNPSAPVWHYIIEKTVRSEEFFNLVRKINGSSELAEIAAIKFLETILNEWKRGNLEKTQEDLRGQSKDAVGSSLGDKLGGLVAEALNNALGSVQEYKALKAEVDSALAEVGSGSGGSGFSLLGLSMLMYLDKPDVVRARVKLLRSLVEFMRRFETRLSALTREVVVSRWGGIAGVGLGSDLSSVLPSKLGLLGVDDEGVKRVGKALFAWELVNNSLPVYEKAGVLEFDVYIDKSGSMDGFIGRGENRVQKIALAAGLGLAVLREGVGRVYLFDTELVEVGKAEIVKTLMTVRADGGTNIEPVLEEVLKHSDSDRRHLIISDGITEVANEELLGRFRSIADRVFLILINEEPPNYNWVSVLKERGNVYSVWDVASFEEAVSRVITG